MVVERKKQNSLFGELLHRKRSPGLSLFSKRIKLRVSECNANWFVITQRTEATSLKANTTKRSAEGTLPHILIPSLRERVRERLCRGGQPPPGERYNI